MASFYARNREEREDLYQEMLLQIWKSMPNFREDSKATTWMYRIGVNTALFHQRKRYRRREDSLQRELPEPAWEPDFAASLDQNERMKQMFLAIRQLKALDQTLILLYLEELSYEEMADVTGLTASNVGVRINRIKKKLSKQLNPRLS